MVSPKDPAILWNPKRLVQVKEKPLNLVMVAADVKGETVIRLLMKDILDIMCEPKNQKAYGLLWALVCGKDKDEAKEVWEAHLVSKRAITFGEVLLPERLKR